MSKPIMKLGSVTFKILPRVSETTDKKRDVSIIKTYDGAAFFAWPALHPGKVITLSWDYLPADEWTTLQSAYEADATIVFSPENSASNEYNVIIGKMDGTYFLDHGTSSSVYRKDVKLDLFVVSKTT